MDNAQFVSRLKRFGVRGLVLCGMLCLSTVIGKAQTTSLLIGFRSPGEGFTSLGYTGINSFVNTGTIGAGTFGAGTPSATDTTGQGGNSIIVTPIQDPVIHFNNLQITNESTLNTFGSVTLRIPQYPAGDPRRTQLGFVQTTTTGVGSNGLNFTVAFSDPVGNYNGDYLPFAGLPLYSTIHFHSAGLIAPTQAGVFNLYAAYPAGSGGTSYYMDVVGDTTSSPTPLVTFFNTITNPGGGIIAAAIPEPSVLGLCLIGGIWGNLLRKRHKKP
jgi:hypothetical protein